MLILLPPSEGKTAPTRGRPLDLAGLSLPELTPWREGVLEALIQASAAGPAALGLGDSMAAAVHANTLLREAPAAPAASIYTGVLFAAAGLADLHGTARRRANALVWITSALFGLLRPADRIPVYKLPPAAKLPGIGAPVPYLARGLTQAMAAAETDLVVDCRSGAYAGLWRPPAGAEHLSVAVVQMRDGVAVPVSHFAKHTRGELARHLLTRPEPVPRTADQVAEAAAGLASVAGVDLAQPPGRGARRLVLTLR